LVIGNEIQFAPNEVVEKDLGRKAKEENLGRQKVTVGSLEEKVERRKSREWSTSLWVRPVAMAMDIATWCFIRALTILGHPQVLQMDALKDASMQNNNEPWKPKCSV
jgi:hypothetical protein